MSNFKSFLGAHLVLLIAIVGCDGSQNSASLESVSTGINKSASPATESNAAQKSKTLQLSQKAIDMFGKHAVECFEEMFQTGNFSFGFCGKNGGNVLHYAAFKGDLNRVKILVEKGADLKKKDSNEANVAFYAAASGNLELVKYLIEKGLDVNASYETEISDGYTQLSDRRVYRNNVYNITVMDEAIRSGNMELVKYLNKLGARFHNHDLPEFSLSSIVEKGNLELVKFLVERGANVNEPNVLFSAIKNGDLELVKYLVKNGANVNNAIDLCIAAFIGDLELVKFLVENGGSVNVKVGEDPSDKFALTLYYGDLAGYSILQTAAESGNLELVKWLIEKGADVNAKNNAGVTALYLAKNSGNNKNVIEYLKDHGAN